MFSSCGGSVRNLLPCDDFLTVEAEPFSEIFVSRPTLHCCLYMLHRSCSWAQGAEAETRNRLLSFPCPAPMDGGRL